MELEYFSKGPMCPRCVLSYRGFGSGFWGLGEVLIAEDNSPTRITFPALLETADTSFRLELASLRTERNSTEVIFCPE
jgi:hypothetical protein